MEGNKPDYLEILRTLVAYKSVTPKGKDALYYVSALLKEHGFAVDLQNFGEGEKETWNLYAYRGISKPNICFAGHVDVVPPGNLDSWNTDPFTVTEHDDQLQGRGMVDMKGALACALAAVIRFVNEFPEHKGAISFLLTTDEEGTGEFGTKVMLDYIEKKYPQIDFCILGEPTSQHKLGDMVKIGRRGSISFDLTVSGKQGHVAYPELADNPIPKLLSILDVLVAHKLDEGSEYFDPSNLEISSIDTGNDTTNVIPESCRAKFNIRFNGNHSKESLFKFVLSVVSQHSKNYDLQYSCSSYPFIQEYSPQMQKLVRLIEKHCGIKPSISTSGGTSDARFIHKYTEVIEFGLNSDQAHKINEHCQISDLQMLGNVYYAYLVESISL